MKCYKLLKDLPTFKAGEKFFISESGNLIAGTPRNPKQITVKTLYDIPKKIDLMAYANETLEEFPNILTDWFEEIKEPELSEEFFYINIDMVTGYNYSYFSMDENTRQEYIRFTERYKSVGNYFETKEEAEKYLEYLKAKVIVKQDTKGFKPDWQDTDEDKWCGVWDIIHKEVSTHITRYGQEDCIFFKSKEDIEESFEKHPEEWRIYLTYEG